MRHSEPSTTENMGDSNQGKKSEDGGDGGDGDGNGEGNGGRG